MVEGVGPAIVTASVAAEKGKNLRKAAQGLESLFVHDLLRAMRRTTGQKKSGESATYTDMMDDTLAQKIAESGQFGVSKLLEKQLWSAYIAKEGKQ